MIANWIRRRGTAISSTWVKWILNFYAPFRGAGISIAEISEDFLYARVEMPLTWYNANYVGTQFGGSMYAMTDPFYMLLLMQNLGPDYIVWDKAASIDFIKPGKSRLIVEFRWTKQDIEAIRAQANDGEKHFYDREIEIRDDTGLLVAKVVKTLYVRKKDLASSKQSKSN